MGVILGVVVGVDVLHAGVTSTCEGICSTRRCLTPTVHISQRATRKRQLALQQDAKQACQNDAEHMS